MKRNFRRILSLFLVLTLVFGCGAGASALQANSQWEQYYTEYMAEGYAVYMNPGSNETQRNFSWYSPLSAPKAHISVSKTKSFADAKNFTGKYVVTPEGDRSEKITVSGLEYNTQYFYRCLNGNTVIQEGTFSTANKTAFSAVYMTDIHVTREEDNVENSLVHHSYTLNNVLEQAQDKRELDLLLSAGDQASYGDRREYMSLVASPVFEGLPLSLCVGNHDRKGIAYKYFNNNPNKNTKGISSFIGNDYWYVKGDVLFMVFDSNNFAAVSHRNFVKNAVAQNPDVKWRVGIMHHDLYGRLTEGRTEDANENRRPTFVPVFDEFQFDLVLLGHSHYYSVSHGLVDGEITDIMGADHTLTDPKGTVYMVSNSINHPRGGEEAQKINPAQGNAIATQMEGPTYNIIDFTEDSITVNSYALNADTPFNTFTLNKTDKDGGHESYNGSPNIHPNRLWMEFLAFWTEIGEGIAGIWKNYMDK